ncbi:MAG: helix-turn-helix domain-containing protein [Eubacteriales bacterium]|nr:helix-turn-helix domain-containing protein [Eubacteriales bacterium]
MSDTKEKILITALHLFAKNGYEAVSVSMIAGKLGITKGALYRHFKNKRDILQSIVERMRDADRERAEKYSMPEGTMEETAEAYRQTSLDIIADYSKAQFRYWTEEEFPSDFRKLLTLEQYHDPEMSRLYEQYLSSGPLMYMADIFSVLAGSREDAMQTALEFFGPFFLLLSAYDSAADKASMTELLDSHVDSFTARLKEKL